MKNTRSLHDIVHFDQWPEMKIKEWELNASD